MEFIYFEFDRHQLPAFFCRIYSGITRKKITELRYPSKYFHLSHVNVNGRVIQLVFFVRELELGVGGGAIITMYASLQSTNLISVFHSRPLVTSLPSLGVTRVSGATVQDSAGVLDPDIILDALDTKQWMYTNYKGLFDCLT